MTPATSPHSFPTPDVVPGPLASDGMHSGPHTESFPVVNLAEGHLNIRVHHDVAVVTLDGALDDGFVDLVLPQLTAAVGEGPVVLDLDRTSLLDGEATATLVGAVRTVVGAERFCLVTGRVSARMVLDRSGVSAMAAVFANVADALQARRFAEAGYGDGWATTPT